MGSLREVLQVVQICLITQVVYSAHLRRAERAAKRGASPL